MGRFFPDQIASTPLRTTPIRWLDSISIRSLMIFLRRRSAGAYGFIVGSPGRKIPATTPNFVLRSARAFCFALRLPSHSPTVSMRLRFVRKKMRKARLAQRSAGRSQIGNCRKPSSGAPRSLFESQSDLNRDAGRGKAASPSSNDTYCQVAETSARSALIGRPAFVFEVLEQGDSAARIRTAHGFHDQQIATRPRSENGSPGREGA